MFCRFLCYYSLSIQMEDDEETCVAANRCQSVQEAVVSCFAEVNEIKSLKCCRDC